MEQKSSYYKKHGISDIDVRKPLGNAFDGLRNHFLRTYPVVYTDDPTDYDQVKSYAATDEYVWLVERTITAPRIFPWWFTPDKNSQDTVFQFPYIFKNSRRVKDWNKVQLVSTSAEEHVMARQKYICGTYDPYCGKDQFDMFFIGNTDSEIFKSLSKKYPALTSVSSHSEAVKKSTTEMFWLIPDDIVLSSKFNFSFCPDEWSYNYVHVFRNGAHFDGIALFPKRLTISKRELRHRFYTEKKEVKIQASKPKPFDIFYINTYEEYVSSLKTATTSMFWVVWDNVILDDNFKFNYQVPYYEQHITHVFKNGEYYDGVCLFSKDKPVTKKEFEHRFFINKKEVDIVASSPCQYSKYVLATYEEYLNAISSSPTAMFYGIFPDIDVSADFKFDYQVPYYEQHITHIFKNGEYYDGVCLFSKDKPVTKKEFNHRFYTEKKEIDIVASKPKPFDIIFISYNEPNAEENYKNLLDQFPNAKRVDGVVGIHRAHLAAAKLATTGMFWVVDADAVIDPEFKFEIDQMAHYDRFSRTTVYVWRSRNCINDLEYGYGGVKLLPRELTLNMDLAKSDMTTSISASFKSMPEISNVTAFNTDEFSTWRSAFRECVKLSSKIIDRQQNDETESRLEAWCTVGEDRPFGEYAIMGAFAGKKYGKANRKKPDALAKINDFEWLKDRFDKDVAKLKI